MDTRGLTSSKMELRYTPTSSMHGGTRLVALLRMLPMVLFEEQTWKKRLEPYEPWGTDGLKANLELGRRDLKLLKKSVLSVSSSMRHTLHTNARPREVPPLTSHREADPRFTSAAAICSCIRVS